MRCPRSSSVSVCSRSFASSAASGESIGILSSSKSSGIRSSSKSSTGNSGSSSVPGSTGGVGDACGTDSAPPSGELSAALEELEFFAASRLFRRSSALVASLSSRSATSLATFASCTMAFCAATSFSSVADSSIHLRLSAGAASRIFRPRSTPPFAACTLVRMASRLAAPAWTHVLAQFVRPSCSSVPSQQSHTPSLTCDDGSDAGLCPRLRQWNSPFAHADVPGSSVPSSQSQ
mmetsp:Transcript_2798/g.12638  ORF Transcript_2798/g.12638 Transcript_2798/m.12638 type:complete len:234 (+) Transcript_2798:316-1017(+)